MLAWKMVRGGTEFGPQTARAPSGPVRSFAIRHIRPNDRCACLKCSITRSRRLQDGRQGRIGVGAWGVGAKGLWNER
jgi:hypothetical protein